MQITLPDNWQQYFDQIKADETQPDNNTDIVKAACKLYYNNWKINEIATRIQEEKNTFNQTKDEEQASEMSNSLLS